VTTLAVTQGDVVQTGDVLATIADAP